MKQFKIFLVEDDVWYGEYLTYYLSMNPDYELKLFNNAKDCLAMLHLEPDLICIDFGLPDMPGDKLLEKIKTTNNSLPVIVISGQEDVAVAVNLLKSGASDYIVKDDNTKDLLWNSVQKLRENQNLKKEVEKLKGQLEEKYQFEKFIIGQSPAIKKTFSLIEKATRTNINVSITGETGTGKEVVAKAIHFSGERAKKTFVAVNMAAIPKELIESELFGHEKGAFTGALSRKIGKFEEAQGGTLFLDEIAELDISLQSKLLRALQEREIVRVGGNAPIKLDVRIITATHKNLAEEVKEGRFREDLYYRIIGLPIELPPLRDRGGDILVLAKHFADAFVRDNALAPISLAPDAKEKLLKYNFPGNVRELRSMIEYAVVMCENNLVVADDIAFPALKGGAMISNIEKTLHEYTCDIVNAFLKKYNGDVVLVAEKLDVGKSTIYNMLKKNEVHK